MKVSELDPQPVEKIQFDGWQQRVAAPPESGCYVITTFHDDILYIGQSVRIDSRMKDHLEDNRKRQRAAGGVAYWLYYFVCESTDELNDLERGWVLQHMAREGGSKPPFNKVMPPV